MTTHHEIRSAPNTAPWFKTKLLMLPLAVIAVIGIALVVNDSNGIDTVVATPPKAKAVAAEMGAQVRDGTFVFVVTGVEHPGRSFAGKYGKTLTAQGEFVIVRVDVTNVGNEDKHLGASYQYLFDEKGQKLAPSASILSTKDALKYVQWIEPGETMNDASVLFDVAPGTKALKIELHDSRDSRGVKVTLS